MEKVSKHITLSIENVKKIEELSHKGNVSKSVVIDEVLKEYFKRNKKINVGFSL